MKMVIASLSLVLLPITPPKNCSRPVLITAKVAILLAIIVGLFLHWSFPVMATCWTAWVILSFVYDFVHVECNFETFDFSCTKPKIKRITCEYAKSFLCALGIVLAVLILSYPIRLISDYLALCMRHIKLTKAEIDALNPEQIVLIAMDNVIFEADLEAFFDS